MTAQTFTLPVPDIFLNAGGFRNLRWTTHLALNVDAALVRSGSVQLSTISLTLFDPPNGLDLGFFAGEGTPTADLSDLVETQGTATFRHGDAEVVIALSGDTTEPYSWGLSADETVAARAFVDAISANTAGITLTISDGADPIAPTLAAIADKAGNVGTAVDVVLPAATAGEPDPTYAATGLPTGLTFDAGTRRVTGTPTTEETATVTYAATNSQGSASVEFDWTIGPRLAVPVLAAIADKASNVGSEINVQLPAATAGEPDPTYAATGLPTGLTFDAGTRRVTGTPTTEETATVTYAATNSQGSASVEFDWAISLAPIAPRLAAIADKAGNVGSAIDVQLPAATAGHPAPTYAATGLPAGLAFDANTRRVTGTPTAEETATVTYAATNSEGSASVEFDWTIGARLVAPALPAVDNQAGNVGSAVDVQLPAASAGYPAPTYAATGLPRGLQFNARTRRITGVPTHEETVTVTYSATNSRGTARRRFEFAVAPRLTAPTLPPVEDQTVAEQTGVDIQLPAASAGYPAPTYALTGLPAGFAFDPATRRITGSTDTIGDSTLTYTATNSQGAASREFTLTVSAFQFDDDERFKRAQRELSPDDVILTAIEITHPDLTSPVRVVNDQVDRTIGGETYVALRFDARLADDVEGQVPRAELVVDNVGRPLVQWIEAAGGAAGATVRVLQFIAGVDDPEWDVTVKAAEIHVGQTQIRITLGYEFLLGRRAVRVRHDPETSPGIF